MSVGVAVVGVGYWGINHVRSFARLEDARLRWACDQRKAQLQRVAHVAPGTPICTQVDQVLADAAVDAVVLATPASTHAELALRILESGRHVLIEKPLALSAADAQRIADTASRTGRVVLVGHLMLYHPAVRRLKSLLDCGELGTPYYLYASRVNLGRLRTDENALWSLGPHDLSIIDYLFAGEPESVVARGSCYLQQGVEDVVFVNLRYSDGRMANVQLSWLDPRKERRLTIACSKKMVEFDDVSSEKLRIYDKGYSRPPEFTNFDEYLTVRHGDVHIPHLHMTEPLAAECEHFLDCVRGTAEPATGTESGLRVVRLLEAAQESLDNGGSPAVLA